MSGIFGLAWSAAEIQATATVPELCLEGLAAWGGRAEGKAAEEDQGMAFPLALWHSELKSFGLCLGPVAAPFCCCCTTPCACHFATVVQRKPPATSREGPPRCVASSGVAFPLAVPLPCLACRAALTAAVQKQLALRVGLVAVFSTPGKVLEEIRIQSFAHGASQAEAPLLVQRFHILACLSEQFKA